MKLITCIILCVSLTLQYNSANAFVKNLFENIQNKAHKVREDIHSIIFPHYKDPNVESTSPENVPNGIVTNPSNPANNVHFPDEQGTNTKSTTSTEASQNAVVTKPSQSAGNEAGIKVETSTHSSTVSPSSTTTTSPIETSSQGKENFGAPCLTGYMRTPDGRCKPTF